MKFGLLCPPGAGHLNNFAALGYELRQRGHQATLLGLPDTQAYATAAGLDFEPIGVAEYPLGSTAQSQRRLGELNGIPALLYTIDLFRQGTKTVLADVPPAIAKVLAQPEYRQNALKLKAEIERAGGVKTAVDIIESQI